MAYQLELDFEGWTGKRCKLCGAPVLAAFGVSGDRLEVDARPRRLGTITLKAQHVGASFNRLSNASARRLKARTELYATVSPPPPPGVPQSTRVVRYSKHAAVCPVIQERIAKANAEAAAAAKAEREAAKPRVVRGRLPSKEVVAATERVLDAAEHHYTVAATARAAGVSEKFARKVLRARGVERDPNESAGDAHEDRDHAQPSG